MKARRGDFQAMIGTMDRESLMALALSQYDELSELKAREDASRKIDTEAFIQYSDLEERYRKLLDEHKQLQEQMAALTARDTLNTRTIYGRKTEKILDLLNSASDECEPLPDEADQENAGRTSAAGHERARENAASSKTHHGLKHGKNPLGVSASRLPRRYIYQFDPHELDRMYGKENWRLAYWHEHTRIRKISSSYYVEVIMTPAVSVGLEHVLYTLPFEVLLMPRSMVSESLIAEILYRKFVLSLPFFRQALDYRLHGIDLSRQTILNWVRTLVPMVIGPVVDHLAACLLECKYIQNDETYIQVNKDGRSAGTKSFMWVHCSSELLKCHPIIIFRYERTRGTDHLRDLFLEFAGYITSDAYISYQVLASESKGRITCTGCLMHCRRYFAEAFFVNDIRSMTQEAVKELPETKALYLIRDIYREEEKLKDLSAPERLAGRQADVKPKVDAFFSYIHELEHSGEAFSDRMKKAVTYAVNQEESLRQFLNDGNISCDNGHVERIIRSYSIGRANWLFADTVFGAEINALMYSVVETARANSVNVECYLRYLFEEVPVHLDDTDRSWLEKMMPWSDEYHRYEKAAADTDLREYLERFPKPERPRTPRKKKGGEEQGAVRRSAGNAKISA